MWRDASPEGELRTYSPDSGKSLYKNEAREVQTIMIEPHEWINSGGSLGLLMDFTSLFSFEDVLLTVSHLSFRIDCDAVTSLA